MNINVNSTVEINNYSINELNNIRETIENMNKFNQIEILRILSKESNVILNENKYGIHINLTELKEEIINELYLYIKYVNTQEQTLNTIELQKENYRNTYFSKDTKIKDIKLKDLKTKDIKSKDIKSKDIKDNK
jgi:hypothetical protein